MTRRALALTLSLALAAASLPPSAWAAGGQSAGKGTPTPRPAPTPVVLGQGFAAGTIPGAGAKIPDGVKPLPGIPVAPSALPGTQAAKGQPGASAAAARAVNLPLNAQAAGAEEETPETALEQARSALAEEDAERERTEAALAAAAAKRAARFDGTLRRAGYDVEVVRGRDTRSYFERASFKLGRLTAKVLPKRVVSWLNAPPEPKTAFSQDEYGGPQKKELSFKGRLWYGTKWGLNMIGLTAIIDFTATVLEKVLPWQLYAPQSILEATGRAELLVQVGPKGIAEAMAEAPWQFLFLSVPMATVMEELVYRGLTFGLWLFLFKAVRPVSEKLSKFLGDVIPDDWLSLRTMAQVALHWAGKVSKKAMPLAAVLTAVGFAMSHFPAWGVNPHTLLTHLGLGLILTHIAYRTRSLSAPIAAHLVYNLLALAPALLLTYFAAPLASLAYLVVVGLFSVTWLFFQWRSHAKAKAVALAEARGEDAARAGRGAGLFVALALAGLVAAVAATPLAKSDLFSLSKTRPAAVQFQDKQAAPAPAAQGAAHGAVDSAAKTAPALDPVPSAEDMIAAVRPAVVRVETGHGLGSGFIVNEKGLVFSNAHVVESVGLGGTVRIVFNDSFGHPPVKAKVVAYNRGKDIALLQIQEDEHPWPFVRAADPKTFREGQRVYAMGHPQGTPVSTSEGIISGLGHRGNLYVRFLQTDASVNPGNSGGPLFNARGEVVGMNSWGITRSGGSHGMNFAITAADLILAAQQYIDTGNINSAWLGIMVNTGDPLAPEGGVRVEQVRPGSPAALAGVKRGDLLMGVNGKAFGEDPGEALGALARTVAGVRPGGKINLMVERDGELTPTEVTLGDATKKP